MNTNSTLPKHISSQFLFFLQGIAKKRLLRFVHLPTIFSSRSAATFCFNAVKFCYRERVPFPLCLVPPKNCLANRQDMPEHHPPAHCKNDKKKKEKHQPLPSVTKKLKWPILQFQVSPMTIFLHNPALFFEDISGVGRFRFIFVLALFIFGCFPLFAAFKWAFYARQINNIYKR